MPEEKTLFDLIKSCRSGELGAVVGGHIDRNDLREGLYVATEEDQILEEFFVEEYNEDGSFLIITGSAGDGKSALLSKAFKKAQKKDISSLDKECIRLDATASSDPHASYEEDLEEFLEEVLAGLGADSAPRRGLAINLGLAIKFFQRGGRDEKFPDIWRAIQEAEDTRKVEKEPESGRVIVINLSHRPLFKTNPQDLGEGLLTDIVAKFNFKNPESPFHEAYKASRENCPRPRECPFHYNVDKLSDDVLREKIIRIIAANTVIQNAYTNPRVVLDKLSRMVIPNELLDVETDGSGCPVWNAVERGRTFSESVLIWNSIFEETDFFQNRYSSDLDPAAQTGSKLDNGILSGEFDLSEGDAHPTEAISWDTSAEEVKTALRTEYLSSGSVPDAIKTALDEDAFQEFLSLLTYLTADNVKEVESKASNAISSIKSALRNWTGHERHSEYVEFVDGFDTPEYRFFSRWNEPETDTEGSKKRSRKEARPGQLWIRFSNERVDDSIDIPVVYELYSLMKSVEQGYNPSSLDVERSEGLRRIQDHISNLTEKKRFVRIKDKGGDTVLELKEGELNDITVNLGEGHE